MVGAMPPEALPREVVGNGYSAKHLQLPVPPKQAQQQQRDEAGCKWYEEEIDDDLKLCYALNSVLHRGASKYQEIALLDTKHFGKALIIDGKMQSTEMDEFIYHESLIHPPLLFHPKPNTVFIMGGGEGSAAREVLRHKTVQRVVMCDIDQEVVDFCRTYLTVNREAFDSDKLCLIINDARAELEKSREKFDVVVGDLADPVEGGPCYQLYTKSFYEHIVKPKLNDHGVFVTQAGPAGVLTHKEVFSSIYNTLRHVFKYTWGWVMASDHPFDLTAQQINERINDRIEGELVYLSGESLISSTTLNKSVHQSLLNETHVYTEDDARFIYGHGRACCA
ncbi:thermospermine synthase ACAULIS5-like isoform X2 [Phragmites australis]|uniref:thermospermine synthase ACAULIS5-like isoform X2 n=1 Tax=Phragmites australis TaxID=29695 RepID=UPI002D76DB21|nr:thermospermine synthase ACAULIS5-like isoform X2 [Phragmites australis]